jgi:aryl-alcohol dehydrogenase
MTTHGAMVLLVVLITGAGAVGLSAVMAARLTPASSIIAVDRVPARLELARALGATHTIDASSADTITSLTAITEGRGVDGRGANHRQRQGVTRHRRSACTERNLSHRRGAALRNHRRSRRQPMIAGRTVTGLTLGDSETQSLIPVLVDLVLSGRFPLQQLITYYDFTDINQAVADMSNGASIKTGTAVLIASGSWHFGEQISILAVIEFSEQTTIGAACS